jgi:hypothetical protein
LIFLTMALVPCVPRRYNGGMIKLQRDKARLRKLTDEDDDFVDASLAERLGMMWELTAEVWSLRDPDCAQQRLQRQSARLIKPEGARP